MNQLVRNASFAAMIAAAAAFPSSGGAQSPQNRSSLRAPMSGAPSTSSSTAGRRAIGAGPVAEAREDQLLDVSRPDPFVLGGTIDSSTRQRTSLHMNAPVNSRHADNWKRARIVGYTLGVIAVCFAAVVAYSVVTGT